MCSSINWGKATVNPLHVYSMRLFYGCTSTMKALSSTIRNRNNIYIAQAVCESTCSDYSIKNFFGQHEIYDIRTGKLPAQDLNIVAQGIHAQNQNACLSLLMSPIDSVDHLPDVDSMPRIAASIFPIMNTYLEEVKVISVSSALKANNLFPSIRLLTQETSATDFSIIHSSYTDQSLAISTQSLTSYVSTDVTQGCCGTIMLDLYFTIATSRDPGTLDDLQVVLEDTYGSVHVNDELAIMDSPIYSNLSISEPLKSNVSKSQPKTEVTLPIDNSHYDIKIFHLSRNHGVIYNIIPMKKKRTTQLLFVTPPMQVPLLHNPLPQQLVLHLLGHESLGSLHHILQDLGYMNMNSLPSGTEVDTRDSPLFSLTLGMAQKDMENAAEATDLSIQWIDMIWASVPDGGLITITDSDSKGKA